MTELSLNPLRLKAKAIISAKLSILERWASAKEVPWRRDDQGVLVRDAEGELQVDYVPLSVDGFSDWDGTKNCAFNQKSESGLKGIQSNSRSTMYKEYHSNSRLAVEKVTKTLKQTIETQLLKANKASQIEILTAERRQLEALVDQQEYEIVLMRSQMMKTEHSLNQLQRAHENGQKEMQRQLIELEKQNATLVATLTKLVPIKEAGE